MTEEEWLSCDRVLQMVDFAARKEGLYRRKAGRRKLRLLGCWGCRQLEASMTNKSRRAVEVAERLADGGARGSEVTKAMAGARSAVFNSRKGVDDIQYLAACNALYVLDSQFKTFSRAGLNHTYFPSWVDHPGLSRKETETGIVRCIFGNPFRPVEFDPLWLAWGDGTLKRLARSLYDDRAWGQMPILADALEDAGCASEDILAHCRGSGPHTRGCWVVDRLLGLA